MTDETKQYVLYKSVGSYKFTTLSNYYKQIMNRSMVVTLGNCNTIEDAYKCLQNIGVTPDQVINNTDEIYERNGTFY